MAFDKRSLDDYVDVATRIAEFRKAWPGGTLRGTYDVIRTAAGDICAVAYRAEAFRGPEDQAPGVGCAWEVVPGRTPYTRGSELQNAETSAWGRAIVAVGAADAKAGVASRDEIALQEAARQAAENEAAYRVQRNRPPEVRADGSATEAEQARMVNGREPGTWRSTSTAENDGWYDEPGQPLTPPSEEAFGSIGPDQMNRLFPLFVEQGMRERAKQIAFIEGVIGERVNSRKDLSRVQAGAVLAALEERRRANV